MVTQKQFNEFEQYWIVEVIRNPTYRYGQAFLNYFTHLVMSVNIEEGKPDSTFEMWQEIDPVKAKNLCLQWVINENS